MSLGKDLSPNLIVYMYIVHAYFFTDAFPTTALLCTCRATYHSILGLMCMQIVPLTVWWCLPRNVCVWYNVVVAIVTLSTCTVKVIYLVCGGYVCLSVCCHANSSAVFGMHGTAGRCVINL